MKYDCLEKIRTVLLLMQIIFAGLGPPFPGLKEAELYAAPPAIKVDGQKDQKPDIPWFKDQLGIAPKYQEQREGVLGMSWAHFLTMVFLLAFFFGALLIYYLKTIKTRHILERLLREEEEGKNGGGQ